MAAPRRRVHNYLVRHGMRSVSGHNNFESILVHISDELVQDDVNKMKFLLTNVIPGAKRENISRAYEIFDYLNKCGYIAESNVTNLVDLLTDIDRQDLAERLKRQHGNVKRKAYKCILVGDPACGKTAVLLRMKYNSFPNEHQPTVESDILNFSIYLENECVPIKLMDTAGMEALTDYLPPHLFRDVSVALLVFDVSCRASFENLTRWKKKVGERCAANTAVFLVANKLDLEDTRQISTEEAKQKAKDFNAKYVEVSAKTGRNITDLLLEIGKALSSHDMLLSESESESVQKIVTLSVDAQTQTQTRRKSRKCVRC